MSNQAKQLVTQLVWSGFFSSLEIMEIVLDEFEPGLHQSEDQVTLALSQVVVQQRRAKSRAQENWPPVTDCDKLEGAFSQLNQAGIIALHNVGYSQAQGLEEVNAEYLSRRDPLRGYCFYHFEDVARALQGQGLYLFYGSHDEQVEGVEQIGRELREAFQNAGFQVVWNGKANKRLLLHPFHWQRWSV